MEIKVVINRHTRKFSVQVSDPVLSFSPRQHLLQWDDFLLEWRILKVLALTDGYCKVTCYEGDLKGYTWSESSEQLAKCCLIINDK